MDRITAALLGACIGDALGVPVEFSSREERQSDPVRDMRGHGTWNQLPGTWSDDSSLMLCLAESLCDGFDPEAIAQNFYRWYNEGHWTAHGTVFDIGLTTRSALGRISRGISAKDAGEKEEQSNGNGSLMRTLPLAFHYFRHLDFPRLLDEVHQISAITHAHPRSQMACGLYVAIAIHLYELDEPLAAYQQALQDVALVYDGSPFFEEHSHFARILSGKIHQLPQDLIRSTGYVIDTLEASLWCLLNSQSYAEAVLMAVNLGGDTDTTATVTGGLAGLYYGLDSLPVRWLQVLARRSEIMKLAERLAKAIMV